MHELTYKEKTIKFLELKNFRQDAITKMVEATAEAYGPDESLIDTHLEEKTQVLSILNAVCEETIDTVVDKIADLYMNHYTEDEIVQLYEWYKTPLGQKVLLESTLLIGEASDDMEEWGNKIWSLVRIRMGWTSTD